MGLDSQLTDGFALAAGRIDRGATGRCPLVERLLVSTALSGLGDIENVVVSSGFMDRRSDNLLSSERGEGNEWRRSRSVSISSC